MALPCQCKAAAKSVLSSQRGLTPATERPMAKARPDSTYPRIPRHPIRDMLLDLLAGGALLSVGLTLYFYVLINIGSH